MMAKSCVGKKMSVKTHVSILSSQKDKENAISATDLPIELFSLIFSYLPSSKDLCSVECTCRDWRDAMHRDECGAFCWRNLTILKIIGGGSDSSDSSDDSCEEERNHGQRFIDQCRSKLSIPSAFRIENLPRVHSSASMMGNDGPSIPSSMTSIAKQLYRTARIPPSTFVFPEDDVEQKDNMNCLHLYPWRNFDHNRAAISRGGYVCSSSPPPVTMIRSPCGDEHCLAILSNCKPYYFEVRVGPRPYKTSFASRIHSSECLSVGLCSWGFPLHGFQPGWPYNNAVTSVGYHGDDGKCFVNSTTGYNFGPKFGTKEGDVIGCGLDCVNRCVFFTLNGKFVGYGAYDVEEGSVLYPAIGIGTYSEIYWNFGTEPFVYDLSQYDETRGAKPPRNEAGGFRSIRRRPWHFLETNYPTAEA